MEHAQLILDILEKDSSTTSLQLADKLNIDHATVIGSIKSLQSLDNVITCEQVNDVEVELTEEGKYIAENGSHEFVVFSSIPSEGCPQPDVMNSPYAKVGVSKALAAKWIRLEKQASGPPILRRNVDQVEDQIKAYLVSLKNASAVLPDKEKADLRKRKLITDVKRTWYRVARGANFTTKLAKEHVDLTHEMIASGAWRSEKFKAYNFDALGSSLPVGCLHPLLRVRTEFARILTEMGFQEMPTDNFVECSFWNFDALFQPQQHPARDAHDTFFIADPASTDVKRVVKPVSYVDTVAEVHSKGGFGSQGYKYDWQLSESAKNLLRTHTTAVSARMLHRLAQSADRPIKPVRYYSIDRVFRNESLDATHLAEFHQVEGLVADYGIGLSHLKAVIRAFFEKLGLTQLRFKPAYNPYTEPSMEIFSYHPGLGKWVEIGNSGVFRPEMLRPMGLPANMNVIAWGLSLERPTMIRYGYKNIRDLIGPKVNLNMIYDSPICRIEKN